MARYRNFLAVITALMLAGTGALAGSTAASSAKTYKLRWVLAHEPAYQFERAAKSFARMVERDTGGHVKVEVMTAKEFTGGRAMLPEEVLQKLSKGELEMSQTYTTHLGRLNEDLWVLDLPFLFRSHGHAAKVLEGKTGKQLLAGLSAHNMHGLGFTYSGGYRVISSTGRELRKPEDFRGMKIATTPSPVAQETLALLGATPVKMLMAQRPDALRTGSIDGGESTYPRYWGLGENEVAKVVNDTQHSLFLTAMVMNADFYKSLPVAYQKSIEKAAFAAARLERRDSIADGEKIKKECAEKGVKVVSLTKGESYALSQAMQPVYKKFESKFGKLVSSIQRQ